MARAPPVHRLAACFEYDYKIEGGELSSKRARFQHSLSRRATRVPTNPGGAHAPDQRPRRSGLTLRLKLGKPIKEAMEHPVPRKHSQLGLRLRQRQSHRDDSAVCHRHLPRFRLCPGRRHGAWTSLQTLNHQQAFGWFIRALHGWGSNFMVALVIIHMVQVFLFGAYKYPRELTWIVGVFLLLMTLGMAFTGQVLRFDQDAYWGLGSALPSWDVCPLVGPRLVHI